MEGGRYTTWFRDDDKRKIRKILYHLENLGIVKIESKRLKTRLDSEFEKNLSDNVKNIAKTVEDKHLKKLLENWKSSCREYKWVLTKKGKEIVEKDKDLQKLQEEDLLKFFTSLRDKLKDKEFFIP